MYRIKTGVAAAALTLWATAASAQHGHPQLHVSDRWEECAFQLDAALTKGAWRQFAKEAGLVTYFRPLRDAAPMGAGRFEVSVVQAVVGIDDHDSAWNDTFVHPDSTHWLYEGEGLPVPGLMGRAGITDRLDVGAYFTKNPKSNYGFAGGQLQYNVLQQATSALDASVRASMVTLFGPEDVDVSVYGVDVLGSRRFPVGARLSISPYAGVSAYLSSASENSAVVNFGDERVGGLHAMAGAVARLSVLEIAVEYDAAAVNSRTMRIGVAF